VCSRPVSLDPSDLDVLDEVAAFVDDDAVDFSTAPLYLPLIPCPILPFSSRHMIGVNIWNSYENGFGSATLTRRCWEWLRDGDEEEEGPVEGSGLQWKNT